MASRLIKEQSTILYNDTISQSSFNEKQSMFRPNYQYKRHQQPTAAVTNELPSTPSSSALSFFLTTDQKSIGGGEDEDHHSQQPQQKNQRLPFNNGIYTASNTTPLSSSNNHITTPSNKSYGTLSSSTLATTSSTAASTISPDDDDEGLYLLCTHQLLRERGYQPSSCKYNDDDSDDDLSIDSSVTDLSVNQQQGDQQQISTVASKQTRERRSNTKHDTPSGTSATSTIQVSSLLKPYPDDEFYICFTQHKQQQQ